MSDHKIVFDEVDWDEEAWVRANESLRKLNDAFVAQMPAVRSSLEKFGKAAHNWQVHVDQWGEAFRTNHHMFGIESVSRADLERQAKWEKLKKQREQCQNGRFTFPIFWDLFLTCPQCRTKAVHIDKLEIRCYLCWWKGKRLGG